MTTEDNPIWDDIPLEQTILDGLKDCGYKAPTEVQARAIPVAHQW